MKKIITLLVSVTMVASVFAQYGGNGQRDNGYGNGNKGNDVGFNDNRYKKDDGHFNDSYAFSGREKDMQIAQINREYDFKIQSVKNKFFMPRFKKEQMIWKLEQQRRDEIKMVNMKFKNSRNRYDDYDHGPKRNW